MAAAPAPENTTRASSPAPCRRCKRVERAGGDDDRGAVLVVVEHGDVQALP